MKYQGDQLGMTITVRKPTDYKKFYTYYTGTKYIGYRFESTIYDMNTKKSYDVDNNIQRTYK